MSLSFEPLLAPVAWVTLAIMSIGLWSWYVWKRPSTCPLPIWSIISFLGALGIILVLTVLLNPIWLEALPPPAGKPLLTILVDQSESMLTVDGEVNSTRFSDANRLVEAVAKKLKTTFDIRIQRFADEVRPTTVEELEGFTPSGSRTNLSAPILDSLVSDRPQGQAILLISDGVHNASGDANQVLEAASLSRSWDAPIYATTIGGQTTVRDIEVHVPRSQELVFVGQSVPITVEIDQHGLIGDRVTVVLESDGEVISNREVRIEPRTTTPVSYLITPEEVGLFQYQVKVKSLPGEATTANNSTTFQVRVVDEPVKALVLEGKPYWDAKFLLRMLTDDPSLELDCLVRITSDRSLWRRLELKEDEDSPPPNEKTTTTEQAGQAEQKSSPMNRVFERTETTELVTDEKSILLNLEKLRDYQILFLGREAETYLSDEAIENIRTWLSENGGSLVCYRGSPVAEPNRQLSRLLPLRWGRRAGQDESRFRVQVTERGDDLSWLRLGGGDTLSKLPSLSTTSTTESIKPLAVVLGRGDQSTTTPVLTYQPYGTGKVVVIEGAGMWRWAFLSPEYQEHDPVYGTLWQSLIRWVLSSGGLLPGEKVSLQMDRVTYTEGEAVSAVVLKREDGDSTPMPNVELRNENGELLQSAQPIPVGSEPGVYQVFLGKPESGHYELTMTGDPESLPGTRKVSFDVRPDMREKLETAARPDLMNRIAELSDGMVVKAEDLGDLGEKFKQHLQESRPVQYRRVSAWDRWWVLCGILVIWSCSWGLRRSSGLV
ncbi:vWA domain-containing protein [Thalassoglobus polymorphus]|uniref:VWFA domain-containing protein n=1 Tax=Thalassoglobus polymorphus TaxID=2527994 RepID=A0A517QNC5_9PLAN|nr:hypothetical protein [Thalassoglobus polymorphus]QDT33094.1 hypothetical protein Mal48_23460 [Thalassoglobus polymorphus]